VPSLATKPVSIICCVILSPGSIVYLPELRLDAFCNAC